MAFSGEDPDNRNPPVSQGHALKQAGQGGVDAQAAGAAGPVPVRVAARPVDGVEVVPQGAAAPPPARRGVAVRRRHHEVSAVDHLAVGESAGRGDGTSGARGDPVRLRL